MLCNLKKKAKSYRNVIKLSDKSTPYAVYVYNMVYIYIYYIYIEREYIIYASNVNGIK